MKLKNNDVRYESASKLAIETSDIIEFIFDEDKESIVKFRERLTKVLKKVYGELRLRKLLLNYYNVENAKELDPSQLKQCISLFGKKIFWEIVNDTTN